MNYWMDWYVFVRFSRVQPPFYSNEDGVEMLNKIFKSEIKFPSGFSNETVDLLTQVWLGSLTYSPAA